MLNLHKIVEQARGQSQGKGGPEKNVNTAEVIDGVDGLKIGDTHPVFVNMTITEEQASKRGLNGGNRFLGNPESIRRSMDGERINNRNCHSLHTNNDVVLRLGQHRICMVNLRPVSDTSDLGPYELLIKVPVCNEEGRGYFRDVHDQRRMNFAAKIIFESSEQAEKILRELEKNPRAIWPFFRNACSSVPEAKDLFEGPRYVKGNFFEVCSYLLLRETTESFTPSMVGIDNSQKEVPPDLLKTLRERLTNREYDREHPVQEERVGFLSRLLDLLKNT